MNISSAKAQKPGDRFCYMSINAKEYRWDLVASLLIVLLGSVPLLVGYVSQTPEERFVGTWFGWFQTPLQLMPDPKIWPIDIWFPDPYILFSTALFPHFSAAIAAMMIALAVFLDHMAVPRWRNLFVMSVCAIFVQIISP